jgi:acetylornithine/N-succinyldiaminopimelate aminotransferase
MGAVYEKTAQLDASVHMHTYTRKPVMFVRGQGIRLYDDDGREYLDFVSGIGAVNLGHAHPLVAAAVAGQMGKLVHVSNLFYVEHRDELAQRLVELFGGRARVFFSNSGAEANEAAIKLARKWALEHKPGASRIITAWRSFHGRTLATLAATGQPSKQDSFRPLPEGFGHVPFNDIAALDAALDESVCAVLLEPIQGEGGVWPCTPEYLAAARRLCDERGALLVLDEVQTGCYRTGPVFAHQGLGIEPDIMTLAKSLANGLPIGATVAHEEVADAFVPGDHGSTFGGGPVVCAAALATLCALEDEDLGANAVAAGAYLQDALSKLGEATGAIKEVRGAGLMVGISLSAPVATTLAAKALDAGLVVNSIGEDILRFLPPLVCTSAEIDTLLRTLEEILAGVM